MLATGRERADAYLFYDNGALDYIVPASEAIRWSADVWGPGETLAWEIEDGSDWTLLLDASATEFAPVVAEALASWSEIPTADISWRLSGVGPAQDYEFGDGRSRVFLDVDGSWGVLMQWTRNRELDVWEIAECDIGVPGWLVDRYPDPDALRRPLFNFLYSELGHCLGLNEPARLPGSQRLRVNAEGEDSWYQTAVWAGVSDRWIGASLLRPRAGWLSRTGGLAGTLESDGAPVPYAHVYALRPAPGGMGDPVGAFTNARGEFLIEGLPPGDRFLWAHPISDSWDHTPLLLEGAETNVKDTFLPLPVRVEAGRVTDGITIPMQPGRR